MFESRRENTRNKIVTVKFSQEEHRFLKKVSKGVPGGMAGFIRQALAEKLDKEVRQSNPKS